MKISLKNKGFTLIELVTVIVILGLLAIFAIPRYFEVLEEARKATIIGVEGAVQTALATTKAKAILEGDGTGVDGTVTMSKGEGGTVTVNTTSELIPQGSSSGIGNAIDLRDSQAKVTVAYTTPAGTKVATFSAVGAPGTCNIVYTSNDTTGVVTITSTTTGC